MLATTAAAHVVLFYLGLELGTGKPKTLILPYIGAASAVIAAIGWRRHRPAAVGTLALAAVELRAGLVLVEGHATREAWVAAAGLVIALWSLGRSAIREGDETTFMVLLSAHRANLLKRYDALRRSLESWSG